MMNIIPKEAGLDVVMANPSNEKIIRLEDEVAKLPQVDLATTHVISGGIYARTIVIPAGVCLVGAIHNKDHINIMQGDITVTTDQGMKRLIGQHVFATKAGMKRVGYAHAETVWTTLIQTDKTDLEEIEDEVTPESSKLQTRNPVLPFNDKKKLECK